MIIIMMQARVAKLDALENDAAALDDFELHDSDDEEFVLGEGDSEEGADWIETQDNDGFVWNKFCSCR